MNKQDKKDIEEESTIVISDALEVTFEELKNAFKRSEGGPHFEEVMRIYIDLFQSTGNNKHRFLVEKHMKELLKSESYELFKRSKRYYEYFSKITDYYPFLVFKLLQSTYKMIFQEPLSEVNNLYNTFIKFANSRKNGKSGPTQSNSSSSMWSQRSATSTVLSTS
jgi:hypothetical protein